MIHRPHHVRETHEFEIGIPIRFDGQSCVEWFPSKTWHDRVPLVATFGYDGDLGILVTGVQNALIGAGAFNATFGELQDDARLSVRLMLAGNDEAAQIHACLIRELDRINDTSGTEGAKVSHRNGRLVGVGVFKACVLRPDPIAPYAMEVQLDTIVLARHIDAKGASVSIAEFTLPY